MSEGQRQNKGRLAYKNRKKGGSGTTMDRECWGGVLKNRNINAIFGVGGGCLSRPCRMTFFNVNGGGCLRLFCFGQANC